MKAVVAAALVNFVWEGAAIGLVAWLGFSLARTPRVRYLVGILALAAMALAPVATGVFVARTAPTLAISGSQPSQVPVAASGVAAGRGTEDGREPAIGAEARWTFAMLTNVDQRVASAVLFAWIVGVAALSLRLAIGFAGARRLTRRVTAAGANVQAIANRLIAALNIRARVRVVESAFVKVPAVVGAFKPVVLLPAAAMSGLSMEQLEALLAHELAHVRRHDYLVNLLQSAVETLLFYHPAVWLVSRRVRQERELCCDDLALAVCGDRIAYASALADLESLRAVPSPALAATGGSLLARVRRILGQDEVSPLAGRSQSLAGVAILASIVVLAGGQAARAKAAPPAGLGVEIVEPDNTGGKRAPDAPQIQGPVLGVPGGVAGGVQGGVAGGAPKGIPGGVAGGAPAGVPGGVSGGVAEGVPDGAKSDVVGGVAGGVADGAAQGVSGTVVGPFRVGDHIRIDLGFIGDPSSVRHFVTIPTSGVLDTSGYPSQFAALEFISGLKVAGETSTTISAEIARRYRARNLPVPHIEVTFDDRSGAYVSRYVRGESAPQAPVAPAAFSVTVQGAIRRSGSIQMREDHNTISDALAMAGGFQSSAGSRIFLRRKGTPDRTFSKDALLQGRYSDTTLLDGDTIDVEVAPHFYVTGYVKNSTSEYNWEPGLTLQQAIARAGGISANGAGHRATISRKDPKTNTFIEAKLDTDPMATTIEPNDVIKVPLNDAEPAVAQAESTFGVTGNVKKPGKYNWETGMTVEKALALAGGLTPQGAPNRITIRRRDPKTGDLVSIKVTKLDMEVQLGDIIVVPEKFF